MLEDEIEAEGDNSSRDLFARYVENWAPGSVCYYRTHMNYMGSVRDSNKIQNSQTNPYTTYIATLEVVTYQNWCLDNGASRHVTNDLNQLQQVNKLIVRRP